MAKIKNFEFSDINISKKELIWYLYTNEFCIFRDEIDISDAEAVEQVLNNISKKYNKYSTGSIEEFTNEYFLNACQDDLEQAESNYFRSNP